MLILRLSRVGKKKQPTYRLIVSEKGRDPWGRALEMLGTYNPRTKAVLFNTERINYWMSKGSQASPTVWNLLLKNDMVKGDKRNVVAKTKSNPPKKSAEGGSASGGETSPAETPAEEKKEAPAVETPAA